MLVFLRWGYGVVFSLFQIISPVPFHLLLELLHQCFHWKLEGILHILLNVDYSSSEYVLISASCPDKIINRVLFHSKMSFLGYTINFMVTLVIVLLGNFIQI